MLLNLWEEVSKCFEKLATLKKISNLLDFCKGRMRKILGKILEETKKIEV